MDTKLVIPIRAADIPFKGHDVPVAVARINLSPISCAVLRDRDLVNDMRQFAETYNLVLETTFVTSHLLHLLLIYRMSFKPTGPAAARVEKAIQILEEKWKVDINSWSKNKDFSFEDPRTGKALWNNNFVLFINLILQPLRTRSAYVFFDEIGDISGQIDRPGNWRKCQFKFFSLSGAEKTFELQFQIGQQKKGLILGINDVKRFDCFGIRFSHPTEPKCVLFNPFSCDEFARPRHDDSDKFMRMVKQVSPRPGKIAYLEVNLQQIPSGPFPF